MLLQIQRYNSLLETIRSSLVYLENGIKGVVVMSSDLEEIFDCIHNTQVPPLWGKVHDYLFSLYSLLLFYSDLSIPQTIGFVDQRFGTSCGAISNMGYYYTSSSAVLVGWVHTTTWILNSSSPICCKEKQRRCCTNRVVKCLV